MTPLPPPDLTGRTIADFHILRRLGKGGMVEVYLAEQLSLKRHVALKILRPEFLASDPTAMERFRHEAQAVARATHANIVQVYAWGEAEGVCYMALEFVEGRTLKEYLERKGPPEVLLALSIMRQVGAALARAAELGIIHRDIKPENILLTRKGEVKVADFGLARSLAGDTPLNLTQSGVTLGTPLYMSPEQIEGKPVDPRTDIYSFGVTCYHMLAGQPPFRGTSAFDVAIQHVRSEPPPLSEIRPDLPPALCAIVHKMMAKDPAQRYQTARDLLKDLVRLREGLSGQTAAVSPLDLAIEVLPVAAAAGAPPPAAPAPPVLVPTPNRRPWLVAASLLLALALGATGAWLRRHIASPAPAAAAPVSDHPVLPASQQEQALLKLAEDYLGAANKSINVQRGADHCLELALFYLDQYRLDDAEKLFHRLDGFRKMHPYHVLGHLGLGIVAALRSKPQESNRYFRDIFLAPRAEPGVRRFEGLGLWRDSQWRYWLARAVDYNRKNGLDDKEVPPLLLKLVGAHS